MPVALCLASSLSQVPERLLKRRDLTKPCSILGLSEPLFGVGGHLIDAWQLGGVDPKEPAPDAGVLVDARRAVGAVTLTESDLAQQEVLLELGPLLAGRRPELAARRVARRRSMKC